MCVDADAHPPIAPMAGAAVDGEAIELVAADGNRLSAYRARGQGDSPARMLVLPDIRGLFPFYEELALWFAEAGIGALAIDYFGRTAGVGARDAGFDHRAHVDQTTWSGLSADIRAGVAELRVPDPAARVFVVGFCFGGRLAFDAATLGLGLAGVIGFYGVPTGPRLDIPAPAEVAGSMGCPVLGLFGGADRGHPRHDGGRVRAGPHDRGRAARPRDLPRRTPQLLRPQGRRLRRCLGGRLATRPRVRRRRAGLTVTPDGPR